MLRWAAILGFIALVVGGAALYGAATGGLGDDEAAGEIAVLSRPADVVAERTATQASTTGALGANPSKQILFGDFHVHTTSTSAKSSMYFSCKQIS